MSEKLKDDKNRWRNKSVGFRVSQEEWDVINDKVRLCGYAKKQEYIMACLSDHKITAKGNPLMLTQFRSDLKKMLAELETFVCDGLNTHKSESLVRFVSETCSIDTELGEKGRRGILKSMESRADFLHDPNHGIRFVYTPKHSSWMNQIEIWFGIINRKLLKRKSYISIEELEKSILRFIEQYNLTAHPFKWTYAGVPLVI